MPIFEQNMIRTKQLEAVADVAELEADQSHAMLMRIEKRKRPAPYDPERSCTMQPCN